MDFKQYNHLTGQQAENWFREYSNIEGIKGEQILSPGKLVRLLHQEIPVRLNNALIDIHKFFKEGKAWVNESIANTSEPNIPQNMKRPFNDFLIDYAASTDDIIALQDDSGKNIKIAVDVTVNPTQEDSKLQKIRGLPDKRDRNGENRNKNIGKVRKALGIDKHLVLILDSERDKLPSHRYLLERLKEFAKGPSQIQALNLKNLAPEHTIGGDHERLSQGLSEASNQQKIKAIAARSINELHHHRYTAQILMQDKILHQFDKVSQVENVAQNYAKQAVRDNPDFQVFWVVQDITNRYGKKKDGILTFDGSNREFKKVGQTYEVWAKDGRGRIYAAKNHRNASGSFSMDEKAKLIEVFRKSQSQTQQVSQGRGRGPTR